MITQIGLKMSNLKQNLGDSYSNGFDDANEQIKLYGKWETYTKDICEEAGWLGPLKTTQYVIDNVDVRHEIADLACGPGPGGEILWRKGYANVDGYDLTEAFLEKAKQHYRNVGVIDIVKQPLPKQYDIILASGVFTKGHLSSAPAENIANSLKENGLLIITTPHMDDYDYIAESGWDKQTFLTQVECIGPWPSLITTHQHYHYLRVYRK